MGWLRKRAIKKFIENPDKYLVVNPKFCEHEFIDGVCSKCYIKADDWKKESSYNIIEE